MTQEQEGLGGNFGVRYSLARKVNLACPVVVLPKTGQYRLTARLLESRVGGFAMHSGHIRCNAEGEDSRCSPIIASKRTPRPRSAQGSECEQHVNTRETPPLALGAHRLVVRLSLRRNVTGPERA